MLSHSNPYFYSGSAASGIGGPHNGASYVWPMGLIMQAMTSTVRHRSEGVSLSCTEA